MYTDGTEPAAGIEAWASERWRRLLRTVPWRPNSAMLAIGIWSDTTMTSRDARHPVLMFLYNLALEYRVKDCGMELVGLIPKVEIRGRAGQYERLDREQKAAKSQVICTAMAYLLGSLEKYARDGGLFLLRSGATITLLPRVFAFVADLEEKYVLCNTRQGYCPRCLGHEEARKLEERREEDSKKRRPYMRLDAGCACDTAERRTPQGQLAA